MKKTRRSFLAAAGVSGLASLAGCLGAVQSGDGGDGGSTSPLIVTHDTVLSAETVGKNQAPCSLQNQFLHGQKVIFRIDVIDPDTGEELDDKAVDGVSVNIKNGDGQTVDAFYSPHPPDNPTDKYWVAPWTIPGSFPAGPVNYEIVVDASREAKVHRFDVPPANLMVLEGTFSGGQN
ncbi:MAG: hypothetical protein ABEJ06_00170 [Haloarculaceae archaeon]